MNPKTFGDKLKALRLEARSTMKQVAALLDVTEDTIRNWEKGRTVPCPRNRQKLETVFGTHIFETP